MGEYRGNAITSPCYQKTEKGNCTCKPKCRICGFGPHWAVHLGCKDDPNQAYDHEYQPAHQPKETP